MDREDVTVAARILISGMVLATAVIFVAALAATAARVVIFILGV